MDTSFFSLPLFLFTINIFALTSSSDFTPDQEALLTLKNSLTSDPNRILSNNWSTNTSICNWIGISCTTNHQRVTSLNLSGFGLRGNLVPHLGNLTSLRSLDISSNNFTGVLPSELSRLHYLNAINVSQNSLGGDIPTAIFTNMSELIEIDMRSNNLLSQLPSDICNNTPKLKSLFLTGNQLYGKIPANIYKCTELEDLRLSLNKFNGEIPSEIGNLTMLNTLSLSSNLMEGEIPSSMFNISLLKHVDLRSNSFTGRIPTTFKNSPKLQYLYLDANNLSGSIPEEIGFLGSLNYLVLTNNNLTGDIPKQVENLTSLIMLDLAYNKLTGKLPEGIGMLANLEVFAAPFNDFLNGSIPPSIFNMSTLQILSLQQNQFSGTLPQDYGLSLPNLEELYLFFNSLSGEIPTAITNASKLTMLELNKNFFTGSIPNFGNLRSLRALRLWENYLTSDQEELTFLSSLTSCRNLEVLEISDNPGMKGSLPSSVGNLSTSLITFRASICSIRGAIPSEIGNLISLQTLDLSQNQLTGFIPTALGKLNQVVELSLSSNQLQGSIPLDLCQISDLGELDLSDNMLTGSTPGCLGGIRSLQRVSLASNKLNSTLPSEFFNLKDLISLDLSSNYLSGQLPSEIGSLKAMFWLNLSFNHFSGSVPSSISGCESLEYLYVSNNMFSGSIPESLEKTRGLRSLDLSSNNLSGVIPMSLEKLDLDYFNVSNNKLEGEIPQGGHFGNFTAESFAHNFALCGEIRLNVPPCKENDEKRSWSEIVGRVMMYVVLPFIVVVICVVIVVFLIKKRKQKEIPVTTDISLVGVSWKVISERELVQGTGSFSEINILGKGSFGTVFKGTLSDGMQVAVKVFNLRLEGASKSFGTESQILSTIRHRNLVRILGCCSNTEFKALILEYMPNGCLDKRLHSDTSVLDLVERLNIAIDVALALEYLHHGHTFVVVHCDIKPSNVLLDEDMTARVTDFGISRLFEDGDAKIHTITMGTIGYAAPEVGSNGKISTSGDVYSYGILLLEMFTSKRPTDEMFNGEMSIKEWVQKALREKAVRGIVASGLLSSEDPHLSTKLDCVTSIFDLAMKCSAILPGERINMMQAVAVLQKFKVAVRSISSTSR